MRTPVRPLHVCPPGVYEDPFTHAGGGVSLHAVDADGRCVACSTVHTRDEYEAEASRLKSLVSHASSASVPPDLKLV